ncbi:MAG TPA: SET domain-containing protein [Leptolyngbyaceae cyanobacterium M33_DOE_097]|uniref:SET domain-containing protein-lysine N-methyltransferase n=1 Tax=Oscillatoriales cyanobacterium SpSt-418 TaxID=2282169 RepID=A0A7C3PQE0_9CYAN|nr:SET domain-containing protein [Leptolyngbyaceae cyanobacterium M33_DOE_097]
MMHPHTELRYINDAIGYGVFATRLIPKGTITWILDDLDQHYKESEVLALEPLRRDLLVKYSYRDEQGRYVLCWDLARYVNHSFNPSCIATPYQFELASRDIYPGEELTDDYGYLNLDQPFYCHPEPDCDRTVVLPDDILVYYPTWDAVAADAFKCFNQVDQPLAYLIDRKYRDRVDAVANGTIPMDSILSCYYDRSKRSCA